MVSVGPAYGVQVLPEGAIEGQGAQGGMNLAEAAEVHRREEVEHPQEQLRGKVKKREGLPYSYIHNHKYNHSPPLYSQTLTLCVSRPGLPTMHC